MAISLNVSKWEINDNEIAKYCPAPYGSAYASSFQLYIPTLMPLINGPSKPTQVISSLSSTCYLNDTTCKPSIAKTIKTQNYKTVPRYENNSFQHSIFYQGASMQIEVINKDVHDMRVTNRVDNSTDLPDDD